MLTLEEYKEKDKVKMEQLDEEIHYYFEKAGDKNISCEQMDRIVAGIFQTACRIYDNSREKIDNKLVMVMADHEIRQKYRLMLEINSPKTQDVVV